VGIVRKKKGLELDWGEEGWR